LILLKPDFIKSASDELDLTDFIEWSAWNFWEKDGTFYPFMNSSPLDIFIIVGATALVGVAVCFAIDLKALAGFALIGVAIVNRVDWI